MKTVNTVFWCTFFVIQRGCPPELLTPLFNYLRENCPFINDLEPDEKGNYEHQFIEIHDDLLNNFVQSIDGICEEWVESEAGEAFIAMWIKAKYIPFLSLV